MPSESTFRRTLQRLDADAFDDLAGAWAQQAHRARAGRRRVIAVDGKTLRGSGQRRANPAVTCWPPSIMLTAWSWARWRSGAKTNEIPMFPTLLDRIDITGAVITADAMHAQRAHATYLAGARRALPAHRQAQPARPARPARRPALAQVPVAHDTRERGHGRAERRTLKVTAVAAGLAFPHAAQAIQIVRRRKPAEGRNGPARPSTRSPR